MTRQRLSLRGFRFILMLALVLAPAVLLAEPQHVTILHFNDFHGHLEPDGDRGGAAQIAGIVRAVEQENQAKGVETIVLFGGDAVMGTLVSSEFEGEAEFAFLDELGVDAMTPGNHEFDFGEARFEELATSAAFPVVSANISRTGSGERLLKPCVVLTSGIGVIGLITPQVRTLTMPSNVAGLTFADPAKEAKRALKLAECRAPIMLALTHEGVSADVALAKKVRGLSAVIGGHDHVRPEEYCREVRGIPVCQTPPNGRFVGRIDLAIENGKVVAAKEGLIPVDATAKPDPGTHKLVERYARKISGKYDRVIGRASEALPARGKGQTKLGMLVAESMREAGNAEIAFINSSGVRTSLKKGPIRLRDLAEVLPFPNRIVVFSITGAELEKVVAHGVGRRGEGGLQVAGFSFDVEDGKPVDIRVGGAPLDPATSYVAATVDFLTSGGSGFAMLAKIPDQRATGVLVLDAAAASIERKKIIP